MFEKQSNRFIMFKNILGSDSALLFNLALIKFVFHIATAGSYGYFRDELYFIACSDHLDWGYVDHPPLSIFILKIVRCLLGDSLYAIRLLSSVAGAVAVFLTGLMVRRLGGKRYAQVMAALAFIVAPVMLGQYRYFSMNAFDILFWATASYLIILIIKNNNPKLWPVFGIVAGLGLQNKYSIGFLCIGLLGGLLLTPHRQYLRTIWFWTGMLIAFLIILPHILWEIIYKFPTIEFMQNTQLTNSSFSPLGFFFDQIGEIGRASSIIWLFGLFYCFFDKTGKQYRLLGWMYVMIFCLMVISKAKAYYLAPVYPMLLASGSIIIERLTQQYRVKWLMPIYASLIIVIGLIDIPFAIPILPVETFLKYQEFLGAAPRQNQKEKMGILHQNFADMFGWEEMVAAVAKTFNSLTTAEQTKCAVIVDNWGEAGAIDFFGKAYHLPKATCGHNSYWFWGPGNATGEIVIRLGSSRESLQKNYREVILSERFENKYCMPYENKPIFVCRSRNDSIRNDWQNYKHFN